MQQTQTKSPTQSPTQAQTQSPKSLKRKKILITGCSGFLASHLIEKLNKENDNPPEIYGITEVQDFQSEEQTVYHVDIRSRERVFETVEAIRPDEVYHLAAIANVGFSWRNQKLTYEVNFIGTSNLLEALTEYTPKARVLLMSSAELYGDSAGNASSESSPLSKPGNPYSLSKRAMEMLGDLFSKASDLHIVKLRSFNFTGPGQSRQFVASDFSGQIAEIEKGRREPVIMVGNLSAIRDLSDVRDIARYIAVIAQKGENGGVYNLCSGQTFSIRQVLDMLLSLSTSKIDVVVDQDKLRPVDVAKLWGSNELIAEKFELKPVYGIKQTLSDLLDYWRARV
jgi:GDP-4-dehydro-6-deoxy-D-mannose reductase